jgi:predicted dehydrogenase
MTAERPGNIVVLSGRNRGKIALIRAAVESGLNVLADKPWIIGTEDLPALEATLAMAQQRGVVAYDIMTERYEITSMLQRELVNDPGTFGEALQGTESEPAVYMESVHHILKQVVGVTNLRPVWFFDVAQQGEALADVGTHLVDLVQWTLFPERPMDYRRDVQMFNASHWPTSMTAAQFEQVTGQPGGPLDYYCNTRVSYALRGIHTRLDVLWRWEAPEGTGDTHMAIYRGTKSDIEVRQGKEENFTPELYVTSHDRSVKAALGKKMESLERQYPGIGLERQSDRTRVTIPDVYRVGHEAHFAQVARQFFQYLEQPETLPAWENPNMLAKYYVSTKGVELSRA